MMFSVKRLNCIFRPIWGVVFSVISPFISFFSALLKDLAPLSFNYPRLFLAVSFISHLSLQGVSSVQAAPSSGDCTTTVNDASELANAKASAQPGQVICLNGGNYGSVSFSASDGSGTGWGDHEKIVYKPAPGENPVFEHLNIIDGDKYIEFDGINVVSPSNINAVGRSLLEIRDASHVRILNCNVIGTWIPNGDRLAEKYWIGSGIYIDGKNIGVSDVEINGCDIQGFAKGISLVAKIRDDLVIKNNHVHIVSSSLILTNTDHGNGEIIIENNHLHDRRAQPGAHGSGIAIRDSHVTVRGNHIHDFGGSGGIRFYAYPPDGYIHEDILIEKNLIYDGYSTYLSFGAIKGDITVRDNTVVTHWRDDPPESGRWRHSGGIGFGAGSNDTSNVFVHNNIFIAMTSVDPAIQNFVEDNNIFWNFQYGQWNFLDTPLGDNTIITNGANGFLPGFDDSYFEGSGNFFVGGADFDTYSFGRINGDHHKKDLYNAYVPMVGSDACDPSTGLITKGHLAGQKQACATLSSVPYVFIAEPQEGGVLTASTVDVTYTESGDLSEVDHVHLKLDLDPEVMDLDNDGTYQFKGVSEGPHTLTVYLARADHTQVGGPVTRNFNVDTITPPSPSPTPTPTPTPDPGDPPSTQKPAPFINVFNPLKESIQIPFNLNQSQEVEVTVYDRNGEEVVQLFKSVQPAGSGSVSWDGKNAKGSIVSSGVYFVQIKIGSDTQTLKVVVLK